MSDTSWKRGPRSSRLAWAVDMHGAAAMNSSTYGLLHSACRKDDRGPTVWKTLEEQPCVWWWWRRRHIAWHTDLSSAASILRLSHNSTRHANLFQRLYALLGPFPHNRDLETHFMSDSIGYARSLRSCWWKYIADNIRLMAAYAWTCVRMSCWQDLRFRIALRISFRNCSAAWSSYCYAAVLALLYQR